MTGINGARSLARPLMGLLGVCGALALASCGGGDSSGTSVLSTNGTLAVQLGDTPACGYDHVYITVDHIEISMDGSAWTTFPVSSSVKQPIDLLALQNGTLLTLGQSPLPAGTYQQVRLVLKTNAGGPPYANSLVLSGTNTQTPLKTPSGQQSGYKILGPITVASNTLADLILDFNACKSIVAAGASGQYLLKPVVTAIAKTVSGSITGSVSAGASVFAEQQAAAGPVIIAGTTADLNTGAFTLSPILQSSSGGNVDVVVVPAPPPGSATNGLMVNIVQDVPVMAGQATSLGSITGVATTINQASGTVTVAGVAGAANLTADQTLTASNRTYELASTATTTGQYAFRLAAGGPWVAPYSASLPLTFTQDVAVADVGHYTLIATDEAGTSASQGIDLTSGPVSSVNFTLNP
jgi:hypothetical protein